jgi:3-hydroxypropanoate dehydrogenase
MKEQTMSAPIPPDALRQIFTEARTHHHWLARPIPDQSLRDLYELAKWGPTSANSLPMRLVFIRSAAQKERLLPALFGGNVEQVRAAPVTAIVAYDQRFYDQLPTLFPHGDLRAMFAGDPAIAERSAWQNSSLQGAYLILAARALGIDAGPMGGFDAAKVDAAFLAGTTWRSNFLCNLGYGDAAKVHPRGPRLDFAVACTLI